MNKFIYSLFLLCLSGSAKAQLPVYDDPVFHGAADPVVVYHQQQQLWYMLYTNRRATLADTTGVQWVHNTRIGIATSRNGLHWQYKDTADIPCRSDSAYTHWAPDIITHNGRYHLYLTYVPGTFSDWKHPRHILHCTSTDLVHWQYESRLPLASDKVIDASVYRVNDTLWRMWYNNEQAGKVIFYAESRDLYRWEDKGIAIRQRGEGPKVFAWQGRYFMIIDEWRGMSVFSSTDLLNWTKQPNRILEEAGTATDDEAIGGHCDVVVKDGNAYIFYFTHPGRNNKQPAPRNTFGSKRSVIQIRELQYRDGQIVCDRDAAPQHPL
jgi:predicted GH43/DUF377 family glycosyl hydrolase